MEGWDEETFEISSPPPIDTEHHRVVVSFTLALTLASVVTAVAVGLCVFGTMYGLNLEGVRKLVDNVTNSEINATAELARNFFNRPVSLLNAVEERLRVGLLSGSVSLSDLNNATFIRDQLFAESRSCHCSMFVGRPDGSFEGYSVFEDMLYVSAGQSGVVYNRNSDYLGNAVGFPISVRDDFNVTDRIWYRDVVASNGRQIVTEPYAFAQLDNSSIVGVTGAVGLYEDLEPPSFEPDFRPLCTPPSPNTSQPRPVLMVVGFDLSLKQLSERFRGADLGKGGIGWLFSDEGAMVACTDVKALEQFTASQPHGEVGRVTDFPVPIVHATMVFATRQSQIGLNDFPQYNQRLRRFYNEEVEADGIRYVVSLDKVNGVTDSVWFVAVAVPRDAYYGSLDEANKISLLIVFLVICPVVAILSAASAYFLFSRPSTELASRMDSMSRLKLSRAVPVRSRIREIAAMQSSFNAMTQAVSGFQKYAPVPVVKKLLTEANYASLGVEETIATCFFSDIVGFSTISEKFAPSIVIGCLEEYFNCMIDIIHERNGIVGDLIGDAVFAFWNAPLEKVPFHARSAVSAAWEQQRVLDGLRKGWAARGLPELYIRIGVHTGSVLAGNVGSTTRLKYTLMGDNVNLAARLESIGKFYKLSLVISEVTFLSEGVREMFVCRCVDYIVVVGKSEPTLILTVTAKRDQATPEQVKLEKLSHQMMGLYKNGAMVEAMRVIEQMLVLEPGSYSIMLIRDRIAKMLAEGVPEHWNGATTMSEK